MTREEINQASRQALQDQDYQYASALERVGGRLDKLIDAGKRLAERLNRMVQELEMRGTEASFNWLGEVQGAGSEIDRLCGELNLAIEILENRDERNR